MTTSNSELVRLSVRVAENTRAMVRHVALLKGIPMAEWLRLAIHEKLARDRAAFKPPIPRSEPADWRKSKAWERGFAYGGNHDDED